MNKLILASATMLSLSLLSCDKETVMTEGDVPSSIKTYITTHFASHNVLQYLKDKEGTKLTYDITLSEGVFLEFNRKKEIIDIESNNALPQSVIPTKIAEYVSQNFSSNYIKSWELDDKNQKVTLDNNIELEFTQAGDFLRIDS